MNRIFGGRRGFRLVIGGRKERRKVVIGGAEGVGGSKSANGEVCELISVVGEKLNMLGTGNEVGLLLFAEVEGWSDNLSSYLHWLS